MDPYSSQTHRQQPPERPACRGSPFPSRPIGASRPPRVEPPRTAGGPGCRMAQPARPAHRDSGHGAAPPAVIVATCLMALAMIGDVTRRVTSPEFIGRADELALLQRALAETADGHASHILLAGEAGVGKSRLAARGRGRCPGVRLAGAPWRLPGPGRGRTALWPYAELLRAMDPRHRPSGGAGLRGHDRRWTWAGWCPSCDPGMPRRRRTAGCRRASTMPCSTCWHGCRRGSPVLVVLEDIHWADTDTLGATSSTPPGGRSERVALLMTYRSDELHRRHPLRSLAGRGRTLHPPDAPGPGALRRARGRASHRGGAGRRAR